MLQQNLKLATSAQHENLEQLMFVNKIMNGTLSVAEYQQILLTNYIVHTCYENLIHNSLSPDLQQQLHIKTRQKLSALQADLAEIGLEKTVVSGQSNFFTGKNSTAALLGAMYVFEGATLGGNVIVKKLKVNQNLQKLKLNFHYYQVYGENLIQYWKQFCEVLNTKVAEKDFAESTESALQVFDYFEVAQQNLPSQNHLLQHS